MTTEQLLLLVNAILIGIVGFFLVRTMGKLDTTSDRSIATETKLALLEQKTTLKHESLEDSLEELKDVIKEMTKELKAYNQKN